jgi:hypothetical protein
MPSSILFFKNMAGIYRLHYAGLGLRKYIKLFLPAVLLIGLAVSTGGCAANKCDCPKFSGHRVGH